MTELVIVDIHTDKETGIRIPNAEVVPEVGTFIIQTNDVSGAAYGAPDYIGSFVVRKVVHHYGFVDQKLSEQSVLLMCEPYPNDLG